MSIKQSDSARHHSLDGEGRSPCWHRGRELSCLRVLAQSEMFILPYQQFHCAHRIQQSDCETLSISFSTHEIIVSGQQLDEVVLALQELSVDWIKAIPARYRAAPGNDGAWITRIEVKAHDQ
jgi:hypothetical protein